MTLRNYLWILSLSVLVLTACSTEEPGKQISDMPHNTIVFEDDITPAPVMEEAGGKLEVSFTAAEPWTAKISSTRGETDWLELSPESGPAGEASITLNAKENTDYSERNALVLIHCGDRDFRFTVTQKQKDAILLSSDKQEIGAVGGMIEIKYKANVEASIEIASEDASWIRPVQTRALSDRTALLEILENDSEEPRTGTVCFTDGDIREFIKIYQHGSRPELLLYEDSQNVGSTGGTIKVEVTSNTDYKVEIPSCSWLRENVTRSYSTYTHFFTVDPNEGYDSRDAVINFINGTTGQVEKYSVHQMQKDAIIVAKDTCLVNGKGDRLDFVINTNVDFDVVLDCDWIHRVENRTRALQPVDLSFDIDARPDKDEEEKTREGHIYIRQKGGSEAQKITVIQDPYEIPVLVDVQYRRDFGWIDAHDNIPLTSHLIVYRDRTYSNGKTYTDKFVSGNCGVESLVISRSPKTYDDLSYNKYKIREFDGKFYQFIDYDRSWPTYTPVGDIYIDGEDYSSTGVPDINGITVRYLDSGFTRQELGVWSKYVRMGSGEYFDPENPIDGWYFNDIGYRRFTDTFDNEVLYLREIQLLIRFYDRFLYIDGKIIDFLDMQMVHRFTDSVEDLPNSPRGSARFFKMECLSEFLGKKFYFAAGDTIYNFPQPPASLPSKK